MAEAKQLFKLDGSFVAFEVDGHLYDTSARWVAWSPDSNDVFFTSMGEYLGEVVDDERLLRRLHRPKDARPPKPTLPTRPTRPAHPARRAKLMRVAGCDDVTLPR